MSRFRKMTRTTAVRVLRRMADMCEEEEKRGLVRPEDSYAQMFAELIDPVLDELESQDAFGTEGQLDPRGDHRD